MESPDAGQKEVSATPYCGERGQAADLFSDGPLGDGHVEGAILGSKDGIALVAQFVKIRVICPDIHRKFKLPDQAGASNKGSDSPFNAVFWSALWQWRPISPSSTDHFSPVHVHGSIAGI